MELRDAARAQALGRLGIGLLMLAAPQRATVPWVGSAAGRPGARVITRALGAREVALGLGQLRAVQAGFGARPWVVGGVIADAVDLWATLSARDRLPALGVAGVGAVAAGSAALGARLQRELD